MPARNKPRNRFPMILLGAVFARSELLGIPLYFGISTLGRVEIPSFNPGQELQKGSSCRMKKIVSAKGWNFELGAMRACVRWEGSRCEKTEEDTEQLMAAPACPSYGTRPSLKDLCVLRAVLRALWGRISPRSGALRAGWCTLGRLFGLRDAARRRN